MQPTRKGIKPLLSAACVAALLTVGAGPPPPPAGPVEPHGDPECAFGPTGCQPPRIQLRGYPRSTCTSLSFRLKVRVLSPVRLRYARVVVRDETLIETTERRFHVRVPARHYPPGFYSIRVVAVDRYGVRAEKVREFESCHIVPGSSSRALRG